METRCGWIGPPDIEEDFEGIVVPSGEAYGLMPAPAPPPPKSGKGLLGGGADAGPPPPELRNENGSFPAGGGGGGGGGGAGAPNVGIPPAPLGGNGGGGGIAGADPAAEGTCINAWHLGQRAFFPAASSGTRSN